jgi:Snf7
MLEAGCVTGLRSSGARCQVACHKAQSPAAECVSMSPQDMHNDIQDVLGQNYGVPDDVDEDELLGELDALEADMAFEAEETAAQGAVPSYLQARPRARRHCVVFATSCRGSCSPVASFGLLPSLPSPRQLLQQNLCMPDLLPNIYAQEAELPEAPHEQQPLAEGELSLPAVPQRS